MALAITNHKTANEILDINAHDPEHYITKLINLSENLNIPYTVLPRLSVPRISEPRLSERHILDRKF